MDVQAYQQLFSEYKWTKLHVLPHFILWGMIANEDDKTLAHLCITERDVKLAPNHTVWENKLAPCTNVAGHVSARCIAEKFERLWPCQFLAKEYSRKVSHGLQADLQ